MTNGRTTQTTSTASPHAGEARSSPSTQPIWVCQAPAQQKKEFAGVYLACDQYRTATGSYAFQFVHPHCHQSMFPYAGYHGQLRIGGIVCTDLVPLPSTVASASPNGLITCPGRIQCKGLDADNFDVYNVNALRCKGLSTWGPATTDGNLYTKTCTVGKYNDPGSLIVYSSVIDRR